MSHAEIWDDSALVNSWNEALEEYKHYHSIHARGERVEDVLKNANGQNEALQETTPIEHDNTPLRPWNTIQNDDGEIKTATGGGDVPTTHSAAPPTHKNTETTTPNGSRSQGPMPPQHLIGPVHDEGLKNLLMSWYYAGYYTGLYEGQHQTQGAQAAHPAEHKGQN